MSLQILKSSLVKPFLSNGRTNIPRKAQPGVYMIYKNKRLVYVGMSRTNLHRTLYRHFYPWRDGQSRTVYSKTDASIKVKYIYTATGYQAERLERILVVRYQPADNVNKYAQYVLSFNDKKKLKSFIAEPTTDIIVFKGDLPF